jgi:hypothetical protein
MVRRFKKRNLIMVLALVAAGLFLISCGPKARVATSQLDTPEHHYATGVKLIDQAKYADADREFDLAIELDPKYSKAYAGKGLVKAYQRDYNAAFAAMKPAWKYAKADDEKFLVHVNYIRINTLSASDCLQSGIRSGVVCSPQSDWLDLSKGEFDSAVLIDAKAGAPYYFMGLAYKTALDVNQAAGMFTKVLDLKGDYVREADEQWQMVQKIQRAMPGTITGKKIAFVEQITRADAAALFMEELKIDALYKKRTPKTFDTAFKDPEKAKAAPPTPKTAVDIAAHPLKADIEGIIRLGVRGLEVFPDGAFHPNDLVDRASYAMMIEDILMKVSGDDTLATKFIGEKVSSFPDLRSDLPYYNAVRVVTSRGIMAPKDLATGEFGPLGPVSGADALLIIRTFSDILKIY